MPFENTNDPFFFYYSAKHKEALVRMSYSVQQKKIGFLLTGEYGTGKTFLSRVLKRNFLESKYKFVFATNPRLSPLEFIREVEYQLDGDDILPNRPTKMDFLHSIQRKLENYNNEGAYAVIVVDEAQSIQQDDLLEEIRLLLNIQSEDAVLFTLVLLGQPLLEKRVQRSPQLKQRLAIRYRLPSLDRKETGEYIEHRLKAAGAHHKIFTDPAYEGIYNLSKGMPRAINNICDLALLNGFISKAKAMDKDIIAHVGEDLGESDKSKDLKNLESND